MGFQIKGWHSQVIELAYEHVDEGMGEFIEALSDPLLGMWVTQKMAGGGPTMSPMVAGQTESVMWLSIECPAWMVGRVYQALDATLRRCFPPPPAG